MQQPVKWKLVTETRYWEMLELLPPAVQTAHGFLVGEPVTHRTCRVRRKICPTFAPFWEWQGRFYEALEPMTLAEFRFVMADDVTQNLVETAAEIALSYSSIDGVQRYRVFTTLTDAQAYAHEWVGRHPSIGSSYAVSDDGVGKIEVVSGTTLALLFPGV